MKKLIIIGFFYLFSTLVYAEAQVQIDPSQIGIDDSFRLVLTQDNAQNGGIPDLSPLQKNFMILGTERSMNYVIINGQAQSSSEWTVTLKPKKEGKLTIPAIRIGGEYTKPLTIDVRPGTAPQSTPSDNSATPQQNQALYLTAQVNKKNPYVNQQVIYKVTLYYSKNFLDHNYQHPQVENALLIPLGENKRSQIQKNGVTYIAEEQNYAIFPQKSGALKIKPPVFSALLYEFNPERVQATAKTISLNVQPIPKEYSSKIWLPAKGVKLFEQYEHLDQTINQGNTLIRTVIIEGVGIPAQLLPTLKFAKTDGLSIYPEKGKDKNRITQGELIGRTEIKVTYLFNKAGKITIPELKLPWFNTETGKEEVASLPAKTFEVISTNTAPATDTKQPAVRKNEHAAQPAQLTSESTSPTQITWAWIVAALFACAWLFTIALWAWQKRNKNTGKGQYKTALNELHKACTQGNPQRARDALLKWASLQWPDAPILNLTDLTRLTTDVPFKKQIQILSQVLYKSKEKTLWRGDELWRSIQQMKKNNTNKKEDKNNLPPINPA
ncbi:KQDN repeat-containing protein [Legionella steelei]|uniref:KQDN repeat-containing protein n=1 Tax=Legionella steelei TaxID=947033 RepID=A0A0W0ZL23_9GAMM|nr:protein BatD [Legionella steelei]KTD69582.1 KQDN repeat-containing protein [Legionella steelei]